MLSVYEDDMAPGGTKTIPGATTGTLLRQADMLMRGRRGIADPFTRLVSSVTVNCARSLLTPSPPGELPCTAVPVYMLSFLVERSRTDQYGRQTEATRCCVNLRCCLWGGRYLAFPSQGVMIRSAVNRGKNVSGDCATG